MDTLFVAAKAACGNQLKARSSPDRSGIWPESANPNNPVSGQLYYSNFVLLVINMIIYDIMTGGCYANTRFRRLINPINSASSPIKPEVGKHYTILELQLRNLSSKVISIIQVVDTELAAENRQFSPTTSSQYT